MAIFGKFFGSAASTGAGVAFGGTTQTVLDPALQQLRNNRWNHNRDMPLDAYALAQGVAQGQVNRQWARDESSLTGFNENRFDKLVQVFDTGPGVGEAFSLWRRGEIDEAGFRRAVKREGVEDEWIDALVNAKNVLLTPAQIALGIVRTLLADPGFLPVDLDLTGGKVPAYGVSGIDPVAEAAKSGTTRERLRVMVGEIGLPMPLESAASSVFRGIINRADFNRAVLEGDTRPEWANAIFEHSRQIPSASDYVQAHLRAWITEDEMNAGTALHGMSKADTHLLYLRAGRPAAPGQMATAAARGIDGPDGTPMDKPQFLKGIRQSDIRPEWGPMLWDARFLYPPLFQLTRLVQAGAIDADTAREWAVKDRYPPEVVNALHKFWSQGTAGKGDSHVSKAEVQLWGTTHRAYLAGDATDAVVRDKLAQAGVDAAAVPQVLALWKHEREVIRQRPTPAQVKKAWQKAVMNPATGLPWTKEDALAELLSRGWSSADANTFLDL